MKKISLLLGAFLTVVEVRAALVTQTFNDIADVTLTNGISLVALDVPGGIGFTTSYEQGNTSVVVARTNDLSVALANYVSGQSGTTQQWAIAATAASSGTARRTQTRGTPSMSGTIWFSFLASLNNPNGDLALTFNGNFDGSGRPVVGSGGMRVGLGNNSVAGLKGALGIGQLSITGASQELGHQLITNNVNGAITAGGFIPTNGTAGLVLGRIDFDGVSGYPRVVLWYNPDVLNEASLPAPTLSFIDTNFTFVPTAVTRIGYQLARSSVLGVQNEVMDNVKVSNEPNAFDIVYKNAPLALPTVGMVGTSLTGSESGPSNLVFTITTAAPVASPLTVRYTLTGVATNGFDGVSAFVGPDYADTNFDTGTQISSVTIPAGGSNAVVVVSVVDDIVPEGDESVVLTIQPDPAFVISGGGSLTGQIIENNDAGVLLQYMFTSTASAQVWDTNVVASVFSATGVGGTYSTTPGYFISPNASIRASGDATAANANDALANGDFMAFSVEPRAGQGLSLTNLEFQAMYGNYLFLEPGAAAAVVFLRSSADNYASDLASWTLQPDNVVFPNFWYNLNLPLPDAFTNLIGNVTFRLYVYDDTTQAQVGVRVDNLYLRGHSFAASGAQQVSLSVTDASAAEPVNAGQFTITRVGPTTNDLTVNYSVAGTAINGVDYALLSGSATILTGESSVVVTVAPIDDENVESVETVELTLLGGVNYGVIGNTSGTVNLADNGDIGGLVGYLFNEANNAGGALSNVANATTFQADKVIASRAVAGAGLGNFGANNLAGVGHGYATSVPHSGNSGVFVRGDYLGTIAADAISGNDYLSFTLSPQPGGTLTLTNFVAYLKFSVAAGQTNFAFLRSSSDNFTSDLGSVAVPGTPTTDPGYSLLSVPLSVSAETTATEFRVYFYSTRSDGTDITRIDDVAFQGFGVAPPVRPHITGITVNGNNVTVNFTGSTNDSAAAFKLQSSADVESGYADDNSALISGSAGVFQAATSVDGQNRFYRVRR